MIVAEDLIKIGRVLKPHGVKGEVAVASDVDLLAYETPYLVLDVDGIFVPFFIESLRTKGSDFLIRFKRVETEMHQKEISGKPLYFPLCYLPETYETETSWNDYLGYTVEDERAGVLGELVAVDDSTLNVLLAVGTASGDELLIPAVDEFFIEIDDNRRRMLLSLPEGLLEL